MSSQRCEIVVIPQGDTLTIGKFLFDKRGGLCEALDKPTLDDAKRTLQFLIDTSRRSLVWIGMLVCWAEREYGAADQLADELDYDAGTVYNAVSVMRRIPAENIQRDLTFTDYRAVCNLPASEQREWLDEKRKQKWTARELEAHTRQYRTKAEHSIMCPACQCAILTDKETVVLGVKGANGETIEVK